MLCYVLCVLLILLFSLVYLKCKHRVTQTCYKEMTEERDPQNNMNIAVQLNSPERDVCARNVYLE